MKKIFILMTVSAFMLSCQEDDFGPKSSPENAVLELEFEGQMGSASISLVPAVDPLERNTIELNMVPDADFGEAEVKYIKVSDGASATLYAGDILDLTVENSFTVTAANGFVREFHIIPPKRFDISEQGDVVKIGAVEKTVGEWLCWGHGRVQQTDDDDNLIGFYLCDHFMGPRIDKGANPALYTAAVDGIDRDNYFIFRSNGTYEFSYGKDGKASVATTGQTYDEYRKFMMKASKGYWSVFKSKNYNTGADSWGVSLFDVLTEEVYEIHAVILSAQDVFLTHWPEKKYGWRVQYRFVVAECTYDWKDKVVTE